MTQRYPYGKPHDTYKRRLWHRVPGKDWVEVQARIIEPYTPPTPSIRNKELQILNAPSQFHGLSVPSYQVSLTLLFADTPGVSASPPVGTAYVNFKDNYVDFIKYINCDHKFYDETGAIYVGSVTDKPKVERLDSGNAYRVTITLTMIKKSEYDDTFQLNFYDCHTTDWFYGAVWQMAEIGVVGVLNTQGVPVLYFRPTDIASRAELAAFINRTRRYLIDKLRS